MIAIIVLVLAAVVALTVLGFVPGIRAVAAVYLYLEPDGGGRSE